MNEANYSSNQDTPASSSKLALIIANGEPCAPGLLELLLTLNPIIFCLDGSICRLKEIGVRPAYLLGDLDGKLDFPSIKQWHPDLITVELKDQSKTDFEKGIEYVIGLGINKIVVAWATGRRADHFMANIANIARYKDQAGVSMIDDYSLIMPVNKRFRKYYQKNSNISLIPAGRAEGVTSKGLLYELDNFNLEMGQMIGNSNQAAADGELEVEYKNGNLLLMECWDRVDPQVIFQSLKVSIDI